MTFISALLAHNFKKTVTKAYVYDLPISLLYHLMAHSRSKDIHRVITYNTNTKSRIKNINWGRTCVQRAEKAYEFSWFLTSGVGSAFYGLSHLQRK